MVSLLAFAMTALTWLGAAAAAPDPEPAPTNRTEEASGASLQYIPVFGRIYQMCGADILHGDYMNQPSGEPDNCLYLCIAHVLCNSATWTNYNGGTCWMKFHDPNLVGIGVNLNAGASSYLLRPAKVWDRIRVQTFYPNQDFPGYDIGAVPGGRIEECVESCLATTNCFATTFTEYQGGTCWLKGRASPQVVNWDTVISAVIIRPADKFGACPGL